MFLKGMMQIDLDNVALQRLGLHSPKGTFTTSFLTCCSLCKPTLTSSVRRDREGNCQTLSSLSIAGAFRCSSRVFSDLSHTALFGWGFPEAPPKLEKSPAEPRGNWALASTGRELISDFLLVPVQATLIWALHSMEGKDLRLRIRSLRIRGLSCLDSNPVSATYWL